MRSLPKSFVLSFAVSRQKLGFSLVEMLVAISIMLIMVGIGVASYIGFNEKQVVLETVRQIKATFQVAQSKARAGEIPSGCTGGLLGYRVRYGGGCPAGVMCMNADCATTDGSDQQITFSTSGFTVSSFDLTFLILGGGVTPAGDTLITTSYNGRSYDFRINSGGSITEGTDNW